MKERPRILRLRRLCADAILLACLCLAAESLVMQLAPLPPRVLDRLASSAVVLDVEGQMLGTRATSRGERALPLRFEQLPELLITALLRAEDERFWQHGGVDVAALLRASLQNLRSGRVVSGASTLSMQLWRILNPGSPRDLRFKLQQAFRARQLETVYTKQELLAAYCNQVPLGGACRGFAAAAWRWFGKPLRQLELAEIAALVALLPAPSRRSPRRDPARLRSCRDRLLRRMAAAGEVDPVTAAAALASPLGMARQPWPRALPFALDHFLDASPQGLRQTALDRRLQGQIQVLCRQDRLGGGDSIAVVVLRRRTGCIRALVGGLDHAANQVNCALRPRMIGSTIKPFLYALAVDRGVLCMDGTVPDQPLVYPGYAPQNFDRRHLGRLGATRALASSRNLPAVWLLERVGPEALAEVCARGGLLPDAGLLRLDAALGTISASPLRLAQAYLLLAERPERLGLGRRSARAVLRAMGETRIEGRRLPPGLACKTGTSSGRRDAWCVGVCRDHVVVVWRGNQDGRGESDIVGAQLSGGLLCRVHALLD